MKKLISFYGVIFFWAVCISLVLSHAAHTEVMASQKVAQLRQKMADITLLKQQLHDHRQKAERVLASLLVQKKELVTEIRILAKSLNIKTLDQAQQHLRIHYNIELLRALISYTDEFNSKIRLYRMGHDKLAYLHQLTADDVKMATTLNDFEIDALTTQISLVINKYLPEAHTIAIDSEHINPISPQKVWDIVVRTRN